MVRKRVPASDVDDVVQAVVCDALASAFIPIDERELARWIFGIARNKVVDFHRRAHREIAIDVEPVGGARLGEDRVLLRAVTNDALSTERGREAFEWIVREHDGEELARIAEEARVPAPVVRQRVSRLRRALRARWLGAGGLLVIALGFAYSERSRSSAPEIVADTAGSAQAAAFLTRVDGTWIVASDQDVSEITKGAKVRIAGARLVVTVAGIDHERVVTIDHVEGDRIEGRVEGDGRMRVVSAMISNGDLVVIENGRMLRLVRD